VQHPHHHMVYPTFHPKVPPWHFQMHAILNIRYVVALAYNQFLPFSSSIPTSFWKLTNSKVIIQSAWRKSELWEKVQVWRVIFCLTATCSSSSSFLVINAVVLVQIQWTCPWAKWSNLLYPTCLIHSVIISSAWVPGIFDFDYHDEIPNFRFRNPEYSRISLNR
jgi:ABC-type polysaccharide/polyol phosphate export permease